MVHSLDVFINIKIRSSFDITIIIVKTGLCQLKIRWINMVEKLGVTY